MSTPTPEPAPRYWHLLSAHDPDTDLYAHVVIGPVSFPADMNSNYMGDATMTVVPVRDWKIQNPYADAPSLTYTATYDHEPTDVEIDEHVPAGHRSTDIKDAE